MKKVNTDTVQGKTTQFTEYDEIPEIIAFLEENDWFHDGTIEWIGHDADCTVIGFRGYQDAEHKITRLIFNENAELTLNLDLLVRCIYEIVLTAENRIEVYFGGTGITVKADSIKLQIRELLD